MFRFVISFVLLTLLLGCSDREMKTETDCIQQNILHEGAKLELIHARLDTVQFSDGLFKYLLNGELTLEGKDFPYSVMLKKDPFNADFDNVISHTFPLAECDSNSFDCCVYRANDDLIVEWKCTGKRLRLRIDRKLISEH